MRFCFRVSLPAEKITGKMGELESCTHQRVVNHQTGPEVMAERRWSSGDGLDRSDYETCVIHEVTNGQLESRAAGVCFFVLDGTENVVQVQYRSSK